jgi:methyl-accepting chemotaxis protein
MKRYSLYYIFIFITTILFLESLVIAYFFTYRQYQESIKSLIEDKVKLGIIIKNTLYSSQSPFYKQLFSEAEKNFLNAIAYASDLRFIRIINKDGLIEKSTNSQEEGKFLIDEDIKKVIQNNQFLVKDVSFENDKIKEIFLPLEENKVLNFGFSFLKINEFRKTSFLQNISVIFVFFLILELAIFFFLKNLIDPLNEMIKVFRKIREGDLNVKIEKKGEGEIKELIDSFNEMIANLRESRKFLEDAKTVLEIKVQARTKALKELAESLEEQVKEKTKELQERIDELDRFKKLAVGRELKMIELKKEIEKLKKQLEDKNNKKT